MSKWVSGVLPKVNGSYLTRWYNHVSGSPCYYMRVEYIAPNWHYNGRVYNVGSYVAVTFEWWDEYGITETKTVKKLNFKL
jgi:hypothetical protein